MPRDALPPLIRELTSTIREMESEAQETTDALLRRRLAYYSGRIRAAIDVTNAGIISRNREPSPSD